MKKFLFLVIIATSLVSCSIGPDHYPSEFKPNDADPSMNPDDDSGSWGGDKTGGNHLSLPAHVINYLRKFYAGDKDNVLLVLSQDEQVLGMQSWNLSDDVNFSVKNLHPGSYILRVYCGEDYEEIILNVE